MVLRNMTRHINKTMAVSEGQLQRLVLSSLVKCEGSYTVVNGFRVYNLTRVLVVHTKNVYS